MALTSTDRQQHFDKIFVILLSLTGIAMHTSTFATNLLWFLLLTTWVAEGQWVSKWERLKADRLLQAFLILFAIHIVGMTWSSNMHYALFDLQKKLPLAVLPTVLLTRQPLSEQGRKTVCQWYVAAVVAVSLIGLWRYLSIPALPHREIVPFVSHIRFALNVAIAIGLLSKRTYHIIKNHGSIIAILAMMLTTAWLLIFLTLCQSYTAIIALAVAGVIVSLRHACHQQRKQRYAIAAAICTGITATAIFIATTVNSYYTPTPLEQQPLQTTTANGNTYTHANDGMTENGGSVLNYICEKELRQEWAKVSTLPVDTLAANGNIILPTLIRYLGSMGQPKDSLGMTVLTSNDITAIEQGVPNIVYTRPNKLRTMIYKLLFDYERYRCYKKIGNSSMGERIALWQGGWAVLKEHPLCGVGNGDVVDAMHQHLDLQQSEIAGNSKHIHSQYLTLLCGFGIIGFGAIAWLFIRGMRQIKWRSATIYVAIIILISCLTEDTIETLAGIMLCTFPIAFLRKE